MENGSGLGISIAIGLRYAFDSGNTLGLRFPMQYDPAGIDLVPVATTIHELGNRVDDRWDAPEDR